MAHQGSVLGRGSYSHGGSMTAGSGLTSCNEEILEFQRIRNGVWSERLLPEDGPAWRDARTSEARPLESVDLPSGWHWTSNWKFIQEEGCDLQGWRTGPSVKSFSLPRPGRGPHVVRRRRWVRQRQSTGKGSMNVRGKVGGSETHRTGTECSGSLEQQYEQQKASLLRLLQSVSSETQRLESMASYIGTARDTVALRSKLEALISSYKSSKQKADALFQNLERIEKLLLAEKQASASNGGRRAPLAAGLRAPRNKLMKDLQRERARFEAAARSAVAKTRQCRPRQPEPDRDRSSANNVKSGGYDAQQPGHFVTREDKEAQMYAQLQAESEIEVNAAIIAERDVALHDINVRMGEVKEVFQELANIVNEQQEGVDQIAANVGRAHEKTETGVKELRKANEIQKNGQCVVS